MRPRRLTFSPRRDRDRDIPTFLRDRDVGKMRLETVLRPRRRDRDYIPGYQPWQVTSHSCEIEFH